MTLERYYRSKKSFKIKKLKHHYTLQVKQFTSIVSRNIWKYSTHICFHIACITIPWVLLLFFYAITPIIVGSLFRNPAHIT